MRDRLNTLANLAIIATLAFLLLRPSGPVGARIARWKQTQDSQREIALVWNALVRGPSLLQSAASGSAPVVEFIDYQCPSCQAVASQVEAEAKAANRGVVIRHLPLRIHMYADSAARAAICAEAEGRFDVMHHRLLTLSDWAQSPDWVAAAVGVGIRDVDGFVNCMRSESTERRLEDDRRFAERLGVRGTPTFVTTAGLFTGGDEVGSAFRSAGRPGQP